MLTIKEASKNQSEEIDTKKKRISWKQAFHLLKCVALRKFKLKHLNDSMFSRHQEDYANIDLNNKVREEEENVLIIESSGNKGNAKTNNPIVKQKNVFEKCDREFYTETYKVRMLFGRL